MSTLKSNTKIKHIVFYVVVFYAILNVFINFKPVLETEDYSGEKEKIIEWMYRNDYSYGYADYLDANPMTVYADGGVQISALDLSTMEVHKWVTDPKWYRPYLPKNMKTVYIVRRELQESFSVA